MKPKSFSGTDRIQSYSSYRRVSGERLHQRRNENDLGNQKNLRCSQRSGESYDGPSPRLFWSFRSGAYSYPRNFGGRKGRKILRTAPGVTVVDKPGPKGYPTPTTHAAGQDAVFVGRIRDDLDDPQGLNLWIVADNVRKGAALNAVQIAELWLERFI